MDILEDTDLYQKFREIVEQGDLDHALQLALRMVKEYPKFPLAHYSLATTHEARGEWADAILSFRDVSAVDKAIWENTHDHTELPFSAVFAVECTVALSFAKLGLGRSYEEMGMRDLAIEAYKSFLEGNPDHAEARKALTRLQS